MNYIKIIGIIVILFTFKFFAQSTFEIEKHLEGYLIYQTCEDEDFIWAASYGYGIYRYSKNNETWENYSTYHNNIDNDFFYCITANDQYVWAGSIDGLYIAIFPSSLTSLPALT